MVPICPVEPLSFLEQLETRKDQQDHPRSHPSPKGLTKASEIPGFTIGVGTKEAPPVHLKIFLKVKHRKI